MPAQREKVVVAMSGGVDSSVAACLLVEQGYEVIGLFMRVGNDGGTEASRHQGVKGCDESEAGSQATGGPSVSFNRHSTIENRPSHRSHQGCCSAADAADARFVAGMLGIPFYALNFEKDFDALIDHFAAEYAVGRTPNPCVMCNDKLKFGRLIEYADAVGARYVATGHYARLDRSSGEPRLLRGVDRRKDQSYVLFGLRKDVLSRVMFPVGGLQKDEVRRIAAKYDLPNQDKPDSVEICFVPDRDYARVVRSRRPDGFEEGDVVNTAGNVIGRHSGIANYTIGQRRGLKIAAGKPIYVTQLDVLNNRVVMGDSDDLLSAGLIADRLNLLVPIPCSDDSEPIVIPRSHAEPSQHTGGPCRSSQGAAVATETQPAVARSSTSFRAHVKIRYLHEAVPATVHLFDHHRVEIRFETPQRAVTPGQAVVLYDGETVIGGAWIVGPVTH